MWEAAAKSGDARKSPGGIRNGKDENARASIVESPMNKCESMCQRVREGAQESQASGQARARAVTGSSDQLGRLMVRAGHIQPNTCWDIYTAKDAQRSSCSDFKLLC